MENEMGSIVLNMLKNMDVGVRKTCKKRVTVVNAWRAKWENNISDSMLENVFGSGKCIDDNSMT